MKKKKIILIIISCVLVVGLTATGITLYVMETNRQKQEEAERLQDEAERLQENQYLDSILESIEEHNRRFISEAEKEKRIPVFFELSNYKDDFVNNRLPVYHEHTREQRRDSIVDRFDFVLSSMENWFFGHYTDLITDVEQQAEENQSLREEFTEQTEADIGEAVSLFANVNDDELVCDDCEECEDCEDCKEDCSNIIRISFIKSLMYHKFVESKQQFSANNFIADRDTDIWAFIRALEKIKEDISQDKVVTEPPRKRELDDRIDELIEKLLSQIDDGATKENIISVFSGHVENKYIWFVEHYDEIVDEITGRELANRNDRATLEQKVTDLEYLKSSIEEDDVLDEEDIEDFCERIDELITEYNNEIEEIRQRERATGHSGGGGSSAGRFGGPSYGTWADVLRQLGYDPDVRHTGPGWTTCACGCGGTNLVYTGCTGCNFATGFHSGCPNWFIVHPSCIP